MSSYSRMAFRLFGDTTENIAPYFLDLKNDLRKARMKYSLQEYMSIAIMTSFIVFLFELPLLSFIFGFVFQSFLFSFTTAFTVSLFLTVVFFFLSLNYPKTIIRKRAKDIDNSLPFASLYLSTVAGSKLPLHKTLKIFSKFSGYGALVKEVNQINEDIEVFGLDVNTALERAIDRSPSKEFTEMLWGILSTIRSGGNLAIYLKEKSENLMQEYRRKLQQFSRSMSVYIEIYLTSIVLGTIFFTILTAIVSGIGGASGNIIFLQFFLIFVFLPLISVLFTILIKAITPGGE